MVCSGQRRLSRYQAVPEVHPLRLADYPWYYGYVSSPLDVSTSFSNVSPVFDNGQMGIYRVSAPIISPSPVTAPAGPTFGWQR